MVRRAVLFGAAALIAIAAPAAAQSDVSDLLRRASSSNAMQIRASELVAARDTRPEARALAQAILDFRKGWAGELEGFARHRSVGNIGDLDRPHRVLLDNMQPLDALELSRRFIEMELQALEQDVQLYGALAGADAQLRGPADGARAKAQGLLDQAKKAREAVGP